MKNSEVSDIRNRIFWVPTISLEMNLRQDELGFSSFYAKFVAIYLTSSHTGVTECAEGAAKLWKIIKYARNFGKKNEEKPRSIYLLSPLFGWFHFQISKNLISHTQSITCQYYYSYQSCKLETSPKKFELRTSRTLGSCSETEHRQISNFLNLSLRSNFEPVQ